VTCAESEHGPPSGRELSLLHALVLAGSRGGETDAVARQAGVACKAFAPVAGRPMMERVLQVLLLDGRVDSIELALPDRELCAGQAPGLEQWMANGRVQRVEPLASPAATVADALSRTPAQQRLLVTTADHVLLSAEILNQFLDRCASSPDVEVLAGLLPLEVLEAKYPAMKRTGLRMRDGRYSGCNLFLIRAGDGARNLVSFWQELEALRKSPWRMALTIGPGTLIRYALRTMTLAQTFRRIGERTGTSVAPVLLDIPEAAIDVDTPGDLTFVETLLANT